MRRASTAVCAVAFVLAGCAPGTGVGASAPRTTAPAVALRQVHSPGAIAHDETLVKNQCKVRGRTRATVFPDLGCTPGAIDPAVTQDNIGSTICAKGYTGTVRPPVTVSEPVKRTLMNDYGLVGKSMRGYELDHLVPLELGGANSFSNLWPELGSTPNPKDAVENKLRTEVCSGKILLATAQQEIASNWRTAQ